MSQTDNKKENVISIDEKTIFRVVKNKENPYVMLNKLFFNDPSISMKAKGVLGYLLTKPDNWIVRRSDLLKHCTDGKDSIQAAMNELKKAGYVKIIPDRDASGRVTGWSTCVFESPQIDRKSPEADFPLLDKIPETDFPDSGKPDSGKSATTNNIDLVNNNYLEKNYKKINKKDFSSQFYEFWSQYPNRKDKHKSSNLYNKILSNDESLHEVILFAISHQKQEMENKATIGMFVPPWKNPSTWLNGKCWEDEVKTKGQLDEEHKRSQQTSGRKLTKYEGNLQKNADFQRAVERFYGGGEERCINPDFNVN